MNLEHTLYVYFKKDHTVGSYSYYEIIENYFKDISDFYYIATNPNELLNKVVDKILIFDEKGKIISPYNILDDIKEKLYILKHNSALKEALRNKYNKITCSYRIKRSGRSYKNKNASLFKEYVESINEDETFVRRKRLNSLKKYFNGYYNSYIRSTRKTWKEQCKGIKQWDKK